jgi:hypothetical protein
VGRQSADLAGWRNLPHMPGDSKAGPTPGPRVNRLAIAGLLVPIFTCGLGGVVGVVCAHRALNEIRRTGEAGRAVAVAGLVAGYVGLLVSVVAVVFVVFSARACACG